MKTLNELLKEKKYKECNVKIGSKNGSGFYYCGKANLIYSLKELERANEKLYRQNTNVISQLTKRYNQLDQIYNATIEKAKKRNIKNWDLYIAKLNKKKAIEQKRLPKLISDIKNDRSIHILDRVVKEIVVGISPDEQPCYVVYVSGHEKGMYWTIAEYNKRRAKNDY